MATDVTLADGTISTVVIGLRWRSIGLMGGVARNSGVDWPPSMAIGDIGNASI